MKFIDEYRDPELSRQLVERIKQRSARPLRFMEFCGGHTTAILKYGIRRILPQEVQLVSGPGCPVCVTSHADVDKIIALAEQHEVILVTFGDMLKVPGSRSSLQKVRAEGADVRVVYSARDALEIARTNREKSVVFAGIGFETTAPTIAASILEAKDLNIDNYYVLSLHKLCPPVIRALLDCKEVKLDGIICPGHVSAIIGSHPYEFIPRAYGIACAIAGFEPLDILFSIEILMAQIASEQPRVEIAYRRGVRPEGNKAAMRIMEQVFEVCGANWRGIGRIERSGLRIRPEYRSFDAEHAFDAYSGPCLEAANCVCGDILRGIKTPLDCPLFGSGCTPERPAGPCMVSCEGTCAAYFLYGAGNGREDSTRTRQRRKAES